ncbi:MAG: transcriptional repressor [Muribaculaceae bacterium]|nr:transcriptional repressor [Muribaculaceae bacterium]
MKVSEIEHMLSSHGIRPTANRIVVAQALSSHDGSYTLAELEDTIGTIDKSGIFRALTLFKEHHLVHVLENSSDGVRYELCKSHNDEHDDDTHVHFYCERCMKTLCLPHLSIPQVQLPQGYEVATVNYMVKGVCPDCSRKR